jgi:hypothetical protein
VRIFNICTIRWNNPFPFRPVDEFNSKYLFFSPSMGTIAGIVAGSVAGFVIFVIVVGIVCNKACKKANYGRVVVQPAAQPTVFHTNTSKDISCFLCVASVQN